MVVNISTLGQQVGIISRVKDIQSQMSENQTQITTGVKHQTFAEYGADGLSIQRYRSSLLDIQNYLFNIDNASTNIQQMNAAMSENIEQAGNVLQAISVQLAQGSDFDVDAVKTAANTALQIVEAAFPEPAERLHPFGYFPERFLLQAAGPALRIPPGFDKTCCLKDLQVLRNRRLTKCKGLSEFLLGGFACHQPGQDRAAGRIA